MNNKNDLNQISKTNPSPWIYAGLDTKKLKPSCANILKIVSKFFEISEEKLTAKTRQRNISEARQAYFYLARKYTKLHLIGIAEGMGGEWRPDHATVLHGCRKCDNLISVDKQYSHCVYLCEQEIKGMFKFQPKI